MLPLFLLAQAAMPAPAAPITVDGSTRNFDLAKLPADTCDPLTSRSDEIVVCARRNMSDLPPNMAELDALYGPKPFKPSTTILGGEGRARVEQRSTLGGSAPALMFDFIKRF